MNMTLSEPFIILDYVTKHLNINLVLYLVYLDRILFSYAIRIYECI